MSRPRLARALLLVAAALLAMSAAACGGADGGGAASGAAAGGGFPRTVEGALGTAEIPSRPVRVVALGSTDADAAVALGVQPVAIPGLAGVGVPAWLSGRLRGPEPEVLNVDGELPIERIAALRPDLILAMTLYGVREHYERLSAIAPTVAYVAGEYEDSWQDQVRVIGRALGRDAQAEELVAEAEAHVDGALAEHPEIAGKTASFSNHYEAGRIVTIQSPEDAAMRFLTRLGLRRSPAVAALPEGAFGNAEVSLERLDALDADVVVMLHGSPALRESLERNPVFTRLPAIRRGSYVVVDLETAYALRTPSVLSVPWAVDRLVPELARALR